MKNKQMIWRLAALMLGANVAVAADGTWVNQDGGDWSVNANWSGNVSAGGAGATAFFTADWTNALTVNLDENITLGKLYYRDTGSVDRDLTLQSAEGAVLTLDGSGIFSPPRVEADNRSLTVQVPLAGTGGALFRSGQAGFSVSLQSACTYTGGTIIAPGNGVVQVNVGGQFGAGTVTVQNDTNAADIDLQFDGPEALPPLTTLVVETNGMVDLNFTNSPMPVLSLKLGATTLTSGFYNAASQPNYLTGPGGIFTPGSGAWTDTTNSAVSWTDPTKWSGQIIGYGPSRVADFGNGLDHVVGPVVEIPVDIVIGQILYRDNGSVNRDMTLSSANGSRLIMSVTNGSTGAPLIWAKNRSISVNVPLAGTNGLNLQSDGSAGVILRQQNSYTGLTTVLDSGGACTVAATGDLGDSDVLVRGNLNDAGDELILQQAQAIKSTAQLTIDAGGKVQLNFANLLPGVADGGDMYIAGLKLGTTNMPTGIYSATTHPQFFSGTGEVVVQVPRTTFPLTLRAIGPQAAELSWASYYGRLYDVWQTTNLASGNWTSQTVTSTPPLNVLSLATTNRPGAFYKATERVNYLPAVRAGIIARLDGLITNSYFNDQNLNPATNRFGQFHNSDNMRMAECTPVLVWAYLQPDSGLYQNTNALSRAILSVDYMCRAQGLNGGFNENQGWCGVPVRKNASSSVTGFTFDGIGNAIRLLAGLPEMQPRLQQFMDANGTGTNDTRRFNAWTNLLAKGMPYQFSGSGRGHAPNQDLCALEGVYSINDAYFALTGNYLKTPAEIAVLANEIFYGHPSQAADRPNGQWFSSTGLLGESGHSYYGYDANYGADVSVTYLGLLSRHDTIAAAFFTNQYAEALQYFYVPDNTAPLSIYAENGISRRHPGDPDDPTFRPIALAHLYHPAMERLYQMVLPYFAAAPIANMVFPSPSHLHIRVWHYCRVADFLTQPVDVSYRIPAERPEAWQFQDPTMKTLITKPAGGVPTFYTEIWDATNQAQRHVWGQAPETITSLGLFP